jgi:2-polyprenyl-6-methoxyphenol hydroxylase-like FAD-dependent oxidoreductase
MEIFNFVTGSESNLYKKPLLTMDYTTTEGGTGHVGFICHKQPAMEKAIRDRIGRIPFSQIRTESTLNGISEDDQQVTVEYIDATGAVRKLSAPFLVGADGKTGYVRKRYLEPKGVIMEKCKE